MVVREDLAQGRQLHSAPDDSVPIPMTRVYDNRRAWTELGWSTRPYVEALRETFALEAADGPSAPR